MDTTTIRASEIKVGDEVVERDGYQCTVLAITASRGMIEFQLDTHGVSRVIRGRCRSSAMVRVPSVQSVQS